MGEIYEVVIFTASLSKYADPVLDQLDIHRVVKHRLFRESCYNNKGSYVKVRSRRFTAHSAVADLAALNRTFPSSADPCPNASSSTIRPHPTSSTPTMQCPSRHGSTTRACPSFALVRAQI